MQMVLPISKIVIQLDTFIGQLIHKMEVAQFHSVKKVRIWLDSLWAYIKKLFQNIVLLFSKPLENKIELVQKWQWNE